MEKIKETCQLTVKFVDSNNKELCDPVVHFMKPGDSYNIGVPPIEGFSFNRDEVDIEGIMPDHDFVRVITIGHFQTKHNKAHYNV